MRLLLDSHLLIWWPMGSARLGRDALALICAADSKLFMSAASWWELGIKRSIGKLEIDIGAVRRGLQQRGVASLPVTADHAEEATKLAMRHRDPFDHMLVTQALCEGLILLTRDDTLKRYGSAVLCT